jgi:drug/metabolite transporter (DMT)-like permease
MTFVWGATFLFTKFGLDDCSPSLYIIFRFSIALSLSLIFFGKHLKTIKKKTALQAIILGWFFIAGFELQTYGLVYTTISKSAFITGITVLITPFVYFFSERKKISPWQKLGVAIATAGLWMFTRPDFDNVNLGDIMTLLSTIFWALYITFMDVFTRDKRGTAETMQMVMFQFIGALPIAAVCFLLLETQSGIHLNFSNNLLVSLLFNGIAASFVLTIVHTSVQKFSTPVKASLIFSLEPIIACFIAFIAAGEVLSAIEFWGAVVMMLGVLSAEIGPYLSNRLFLK